MAAKGDSSVMFEHTGCIGEHVRLAVEIVHKVEELGMSGAVDAWVEFRGHEPEHDDRVIVGCVTGHGTPTTVEDSHFLTKIEREVIGDAERYIIANREDAVRWPQDVRGAFH